MARVAVLGTGQLGTFICRRLEIDGHQVFAADIAPTEGYFYRFGPQNGVILAEIDACNKDEVAEFLGANEIEVVVVATGCGQTSEQKVPDGIWDSTTAAIKSIRLATEEIGPSRMIYISSRAVYGADDTLVMESSPLGGKGWYAELKCECERLIVSERSTFQTILLRVSGVYGPLLYGRGSHSAQLVENLLLAGAYNIPQKVQSGVGHVDEFLYVKDLAKAVSAAADATIDSDVVTLNIGAARLTSAKELVDAVRGLFPLAPIQVCEAEEARPVPLLNIERARRVLGYEPSFSISSGMADFARLAGLEAS